MGECQKYLPIEMVEFLLKTIFKKYRIKDFVVECDAEIIATLKEKVKEARKYIEIIYK